MRSLVFEGKVYDFHFKKSKYQDFVYSFYCGDIYMGQIFRMSSRKGYSWTAIPRDSHPLSPFNGFKTRMDAAEIILKANGYYTKEIL